MEELNLDDIDGIHRSVSFDSGKSNSMLGMEFLVNDKKRNSGVKNQIDLAELDSLERELGGGGGGSGSGGGGSNFFKFNPKDDDIDIDINIDDIGSSGGGLGSDTKNTAPHTKTWDGFGKLNLDSENGSGAAAAPQLSSIEKRRKKRAMLKKIDEWVSKGFIKSNPNFTMETPYEEVEDEYESAMDEKRKKDSVKMYGWWFMSGVNTIEYLNGAYNPFDLNLDGWGEQVNDDLDSYEDIFAELYEKYKSGKMAPELSLILRLGCSAAMVNFTNKALSTATPGFNDIIRQSPELLRAFTNATVNTMSQQNPSVGFMNNIVNGATDPAPNMAYGRPPAPVETQGPRAAAAPQRPAQMNYTQNLGATRPDLAAARGNAPPMFREQGVDMNMQNRADMPEKTPIRRPAPPHIKLPQMQPPVRREMEGPSISDNNLNDILAGLKRAGEDSDIINPEEDSLISISSLKELQSTTMPKSSRKRGSKGSRNAAPEKIVSLDI